MVKKYILFNRDSDEYLKNTGTLGYYWGDIRDSDHLVYINSKRVKEIQEKLLLGCNLPYIKKHRNFIDCIRVINQVSVEDILLFPCMDFGTHIEISYTNGICLMDWDKVLERIMFT